MSAPSATGAGGQHAAIEHPLESDLVTIVGPAGTGKSVALVRRALRAAHTLGPGECVLVTSAAAHALEPLRALIDDAESDARIVCCALGRVAFEVLEQCTPATGGSRPALVDDARAEEVLEEVAASLFALEWDEFLSAELDFEITGMRAPARFAGAAYRLIRKLRMAGFSPDEFMRAALRGATAFYGKPPNLGSVELLQATGAKYRDSLRVTPRELARQHAREVDLATILARLYRAYLERMAQAGLCTPIDALVEAARHLELHPDVRAAVAARIRYAFVDDAQDLPQCDARFLRALFGDALERVTLAGDPDQRTTAFAGPRADGIMEGARHRYALEQSYRAPPALVAAARAILQPAALPPGSHAVAVVHRAHTMRAEAAYVAGAVAAAIAAGTRPRDIAVIARSLRCVDAYVDALVAGNVPVDPAGAGCLYAFRDAEDALAALWAVADPYRHDWLLRNLEAPWLRLSDATIAALCAEPPQAQAALFDLPGGEDDAGRRWDRRRDVRLAWNVLRGENDAALSPVARERLLAYRAARRRWLANEAAMGVGAFARHVLAETVLAGTAADARAGLRRGLVARLLARLDAFLARQPRATLHDFLSHAERATEGDDEWLDVESYDREAVAVLGVEAAKGREFAHVFVVDARAGAFPRYYVPDSFLFSPRAGMLPKENVGDAATAARTAKFTYFQYKLDLRTKYHAEERRALYCAASRARERLSISAWGRATRGIGAPEFLEELRGIFGEPSSAS